ncbi:MAG: type VI secretion system Vgr family protein [Sandaracinaceae bacterium]
MALNHAEWRIESSAFGANAHVDRGTFYEALGEPYVAELVVRVDRPDVDAATVLGKDIVLTLDRGGAAVRRFTGIVREVEERGADVVNHATLLRVVVVPAVWMLSRRRDTRIFQDMTTVEILEQVLHDGLGPYSRSIRNDLRASDYPKREYCVQFQETDLDLVHRLMEEDGIYYAFDHEGETEVLVLLDDNATFGELAEPAGGLVSYEGANLLVRTAEPVVLVQRRHDATTTSVVINDWDWTRGTMPFKSEQRAQDVAGRDRESYEHGTGKSLQITDYSPRAYGGEDSARQARVRHEAHVRDALRVEGAGLVVGFAPGVRFTLTGHPTLGMDGAYLITRAVHLTEPAPVSHQASGQDVDAYHNRFECVPADIPFRLDRRTRKPRIPGIQTAVVTGEAGQEITTDEHGRIKVQFHWDRLGANDEKSSCWIRVEQPWSGAGWGFWYVPRIGMEVVVQFIDGDPDRPLVTGCVYNATNPTPYTLPDEKTKSTIKSNSSLGGGGFNEFRYEDKAGSEEIYTHAQKDYNEVVEHDHSTLVHNDQTNTVDNDQTQLVKRHQVEHVNGNQQATIGANRTVLVKGNFEETVDGTETRHVVGDVTETFDANETRSIGATLSETFLATETRTVTGNQTETVTGPHRLEITGPATEKVSGSLTQLVTGGITTQTQGAWNITATGGFNVTSAVITLTVPGGAQITSPGGVTHVDNSDSWFGGSVFEASAFSSSLFALKTELCAVTLGDTMIKAAGVGMQVETAQIKNETEGSKIKSGAIALWKRLKFDVTSWKNEG